MNDENIGLQLDAELDEIVDMFIKVGGALVDTYAVEINGRLITFFPKFICVNGKWEPWIAGRCHFIRWIDDRESASLSLLQILEGIPLKPFKDEDALRQRFVARLNDDDDVELTFFLNPDFPEGKWENHALGCCL